MWLRRLDVIAVFGWSLLTAIALGALWAYNVQKHAEHIIRHLITAMILDTVTLAVVNLVFAGVFYCNSVFSIYVAYNYRVVYQLFNIKRIFYLFFRYSWRLVVITLVDSEVIVVLLDSQWYLYFSFAWCPYLCKFSFYYFSDLIFAGKIISTALLAIRDTPGPLLAALFVYLVNAAVMVVLAFAYIDFVQEGWCVQCFLCLYK